MVVVDASVASKWYLNETGSEQAKAAYQQLENFFAPPLVITEVLASLTKAGRTGRLDDDFVQSLCTSWLDELNAKIVTVVADDDDRETAVTTAIKQRHSYQDCLYIALSLRLGIPLLTADKKQLEAARAVGATVCPLDTILISA